MDAIQHKVISLVKGLSARFPSMSFTYGYDTITNQHLVAVGPDAMYGSEEYKLAEGDVYSEWDGVYPAEDLVFVSANDPYHTVSSPLFFYHPAKLTGNRQSVMIAQSFITPVNVTMKMVYMVSAQRVYEGFAGGSVTTLGDAMTVIPTLTPQLIETVGYNHAMAA